MLVLRLHIETEKLFVDMFEVLNAATRWEERATDILSLEADLSDIEVIIRFLARSFKLFSLLDLINFQMVFKIIKFQCCRGAEDLCVILPSLDDVKEAFSTAESWLKSANPFLVPCSLLQPVLSSLPKFEALQVLA